MLHLPIVKLRLLTFESGASASYPNLVGILRSIVIINGRSLWWAMKRVALHVDKCYQAVRYLFLHRLLSSRPPRPR